MRPSCRSASGNLYVPVEPTVLLYKEVPELPRQPWLEQLATSPELFHLGLGETRNLPAGECGFPRESDGLVPVTPPGDLWQDRVGQLVKRGLGGVTSEETRRAYGHALEMFLAVCDREGNPTLSAELVAGYRSRWSGKGSRPPR
jgi:hypothetical protein